MSLRVMGDAATDAFVVAGQLCMNTRHKTAPPWMHALRTGSRRSRVGASNARAYPPFCMFFRVRHCVCVGHRMVDLWVAGWPAGPEVERALDTSGPRSFLPALVVWVVAAVRLEGRRARRARGGCCRVIRPGRLGGDAGAAAGGLSRMPRRSPWLWAGSWPGLVSARPKRFATRCLPA